MQNAGQGVQTAKGQLHGCGCFKPVVEKCEGCERIVETEGARHCKTYADPQAKWRLGICNFATHAKPEITVAVVKVNPLKASKRASAKKKK